MYPIELNIAGREVLVVGGGAVAARKVAGLVQAGARVRVLSPAFVPALEQRSDIIRQAGSYNSDAIGDARIVLACTDDEVLNARVAADVRLLGGWCNIADDPQGSDFHLPAVHREGSLTVSVGTGGAAPRLAALLRDRLASQIPPELGMLVEELQRARQIVREHIGDPAARSRIMATLCEDDSVELLAGQGRDAWRKWFERVLEQRQTAT